MPLISITVLGISLTAFSKQILIINFLDVLWFYAWFSLFFSLLHLCFVTTEFFHDSDGVGSGDMCATSHILDNLLKLFNSKLSLFQKQQKFSNCEFSIDLWFILDIFGSVTKS